MSKSGIDLVAQTWVNTLVIGSTQAEVFRGEADSLIRGWPKAPDEPTMEQCRAYFEKSTLAHITEKGTAAELARRLGIPGRQNPRKALEQASELLEVALQIMSEESFPIRDIEWDEMGLREDYGDPYFDIIVGALKLFASEWGFRPRLRLERSDAGCMGECYWSAAMRLYAPENDEEMAADTYITIPFFVLSGYFGSRSSSEADYIAECYGDDFEVEYDEDTEAMLVECDRAERLESDGLDFSDMEALELLMGLEPVKAAVSDRGDVMAGVSEASEYLRDLWLSRDDTSPEPTDNEKAINEAADKWVNFTTFQQRALVELYEEEHEDAPEDGE